MSKGREIPCGEAALLVQPLLVVLGPTAKLAGSLRRGKQRVRDADVVVAEAPDLGAIKALGAQVLEAGAEKIRVEVAGDLQVDIVVTDAEHHGGCWLYLTGPRDFNLAMRSRAKDEGYLLNQRGLFRRDGGELLAAATEREVFAALGLRFVLPHARSGSSLYPLETEGAVFEIASSSGAGRYRVVIRDGRGICPCKGYSFCKRRPKECRHTREALCRLAAGEGRAA